MDPDFWQERWQRNEIGFHQPQGNVALRASWERLELQGGARVLVPLCGKSVDMAWLCAQGFDVVGVELSAVAIEAFLREQGVACDWRDDATDPVRLRAGRYEFHVGDFFAVDRQRLGPVDAVVDRAALVALPDELRRRYAAHLLELAQGAPIVLVTLDYPPQDMPGPPFPVTADEVQRLFSAERVITLLHERDALGAESGLRARGLTRLVERSWLLMSPG